MEMDQLARNHILWGCVVHVCHNEGDLCSSNFAKKGGKDEGRDWR
jgi:hypothetical protein